MLGWLLGSTATVVLALTAALPVSDHQKPNFSGTFVLVPGKSDFGPMPAPTSRTDLIDHREPAIVIKRTIGGGPGGDATVTLTMAVDGKPHKNATPQGELTTTLAWEGEVLVMTGGVETPNGPVTIVDRLTLSADGKTLTQKRTIAVAGQTLEQTMVLERQ